MDYGKYKYEANLKAREARKNQANTVQKEIRMGLKIDTHDYETKRRNVEKFLDGGDKVKVIIRFRGREQSRPEMGVRSEEHTSELQSRGQIVCRLLLEKKNKKTTEN